MDYNSFILWMAYQISIVYLQSRSMIKTPENNFPFEFEFMIFLVYNALEIEHN